MFHWLIDYLLEYGKFYSQVLLSVLDSTTTTTTPKPTEPTLPVQDDHKVLKFIHDNKFILEPASGEYNLEKPDVDPSVGQAQYIRKILRQRVT